MDERDRIMKNAMRTLNQGSLPSTEQKERMYQVVIEKEMIQDRSYISVWKRRICLYPWRFAFAVSGMQAIVMTVLFGTKYTNLFLGIFGG